MRNYDRFMWDVNHGVFTRHERKIHAYMGTALMQSTLSTCTFLQVGAVLTTHDWRTAATGYNGTVSGAEHCCSLHTPISDRDAHGLWADRFEIHAEMNAVLNRNPSMDLRGGRAFVTHAPCVQCLKHLAAVGITEVYYSEPYHRLLPEEFNHLAKRHGMIALQVQY